MPGRRGVLFALLAMLLLGSLLRWPATAHPVGNDSYVIQAMAGQIEETGRLPWLLSPLSAFGLYPFSYPTGGPIILAETSLLSSLHAEASILLTAQVLGFLGTLGGYLLAWRLTRRCSAALLGGLVVLLSPSVLWFTTYTYSTRSAVMALGSLLFVLTLDIGSARERVAGSQAARLACLLLIAAGLLLVHRSGILLLGITALAATVAILLLRAGRLDPSHPRFRVLRSSILPSAAAVVLFLLPFLGFGILSPSHGVSLWEDPAKALRRFWDAIEEYAVLVGPLVLVAAYGLFSNLRPNAAQDRAGVLLIGLVLAEAPFLSEPTYGFVLLIPLLVWAGAKGTQAWLERPRGNCGRRRLVLVLLVGAALLAAGYAQLHVSTQTLRAGGPALPPETYNVAVYFDFREVRGVATNDAITLFRWLDAFLGASVFPYDPPLVFDEPSAERLIAIQPGRFSLFPLRSPLGPEQVFYVAVSPALLYDNFRIQDSQLGSPTFEEIAGRYSLSYYLVRELPGAGLGPPTALQLDVETKTYAIYRGSSETLFAW